MRKRTLPRGPVLRLFLCALALFGSVSTCQSQKINRNRPGVYVTFKEFVKKTANESHPSLGARLVLHNNTLWPIRYGEWLERTLPGDVAMIYTIELDTRCLDRISRHLDVVTEGKLLPGKTVSFTVLRDDFPKYSQIFVEFNFSWELYKGERLRDEVVHRVYFLSIDLPRWPEK